MIIYDSVHGHHGGWLEFEDAIQVAESSVLQPRKKRAFTLTAPSIWIMIFYMKMSQFEPRIINKGLFYLFHKAALTGVLFGIGIIFTSCPIVDPSTGTTQTRSALVFGKTRDYQFNDSVMFEGTPPEGVLFSVWTRLPKDWEYWEHNMDVFILRGQNWHIRFLVGNISQQKTIYNANSMIFNRNDGGLWAGDYSMYPSLAEHRHSPEETTGWVWVAWQTLVQNNAFTIRQWLKFGPNGQVIEAGSSTVTFDELRDFLLDPGNNQWFYDNEEGLTPEEVAAWVPSQPTAFQIGKDYSNLIQAKMQSLATIPTLQELDDIATRTGPADTDWACWNLEWTNSGPDLLDISGHERHLTLKAGGQLHRGQAGPVF